jgi:addiction module RelE/StbE family toxin
MAEIIGFSRMEVRFVRQFKKLYRKALAEIQVAFDSRLEMFLTNPNHPLLKSHPLRGKLAGCFTINITGDWRAIYELDNSTVIFLSLGTHSQLYK